MLMLIILYVNVLLFCNLRKFTKINYNDKKNIEILRKSETKSSYNH